MLRYPILCTTLEGLQWALMSSPLPPLPPHHVAVASGRTRPRTLMSSPSWRKLLASLQPDMDTEQRLRLLRLVARMK